MTMNHKNYDGVNLTVDEILLNKKRTNPVHDASAVPFAHSTIAPVTPKIQEDLKYNEFNRNAHKMLEKEIVDFSNLFSQKHDDGKCLCCGVESAIKSHTISRYTLKKIKSIFGNAFAFSNTPYNQVSRAISDKDHSTAFLFCSDCDTKKFSDIENKPFPSFDVPKNSDPSQSLFFKAHKILFGRLLSLNYHQTKNYKNLTKKDLGDILEGSFAGAVHFFDHNEEDISKNFGRSNHFLETFKYHEKIAQRYYEVMSDFDISSMAQDSPGDELKRYLASFGFPPDNFTPQKDEIPTGVIVSFEFDGILPFACGALKYLTADAFQNPGDTTRQLSEALPVMIATHHSCDNSKSNLSIWLPVESISFDGGNALNDLNRLFIENLSTIKTEHDINNFLFRVLPLVIQSEGAVFSPSFFSIAKGLPGLESESAIATFIGGGASLNVEYLQKNFSSLGLPTQFHYHVFSTVPLPPLPPSAATSPRKHRI